MPKLPQVLKIEPPEALSFKGPFTEVVTSTLTLTNPTENKVAFKVKTTAPKRYCVRPNSGVLTKDATVTVSVMLQPFEFDPAEKNKHKFMIQSLIMSNDVEEKEVWKDADQEKLMDTKLRVVFDMSSSSSTVTNVVTAPETPAAAVISAVPTQGTSSQNDLDVTNDPIKMTPQRANVQQVTEATTSEVSDSDFNKATEENKRLREEVTTLKEEASRLRRIAMSETMSSSGSSQKLTSSSSTSANSNLPTGVSLLFHETTNIFILIILFITTFTAGLLLSDSLLRS